MHIVRWLAENTDIECGGSAFLGAARNNNLEMLKFLHSRFPDVFNGYASSDIAIIQWLDEHGVMDPSDVAGYLFETGSIDVLDWLMARYDVELSDWHFQRGHFGRQTKMLKQMYERGHEFTLDAAKIAAWLCNTDIMQWAIQRDRSMIPMLVEATASERFSDPALVEWWRVRHGVVFGQRELEMAIGVSNSNLVKHLLEMDDVDWDLDAARAALDQAVADSDDECAAACLRLEPHGHDINCAGDCSSTRLLERAAADGVPVAVPSMQLIAKSGKIDTVHWIAVSEHGASRDAGRCGDKAG
ncbi:hypothetical protein HK105_207573 [Polyrhizophydium stewartii]|uniref:Ankyrin repeat protein n=1 Tax=Polyrhizophydium stewartii TaxID=2732419 RepID=A0ABR4N055_9FUNG